MSNSPVSLSSYLESPISKSFTEMQVISYMTGFMKALCDNDVEKAISEREDVSDADKKRAKEEYGDVEYGDPKNRKYPLDAKHIRAALSYWGMQKNRAMYSEEDQKKITARIRAAAKRLGIGTSDDKEE